MAQGTLSAVAVVTRVATSGVIVADDWAGTDNTPWNPAKWEGYVNAFGSDASIQAHSGRMRNTGAGYAGVAERWISPDLTNHDWTVTVTLDTTSVEEYVEMWVRASTSYGGNGGNIAEPLSSYMIQLNPAAKSLSLLYYYASGASRTVLSTVTFTPTLSPTNLRFQAIGSTIRAKLWDTASAEPTMGGPLNDGWAVTATDTRLTTGRMGLSFIGGSASSPRTTTFNNLVNNLVSTRTGLVSGVGTLTGAAGTVQGGIRARTGIVAGQATLTAIGVRTSSIGTVTWGQLGRGATNFDGLAATIPGFGVGMPLGIPGNQFAVQIAYPTPGAAVLGSFTLGSSRLTEATWQDVTADVMSVSWDRGNSIGQRPVAGQLQIHLKNPARKYSPTVSNYFAPGSAIRAVCGDPTVLTSVQFTGVTQTWTEDFMQGVRFVTVVALEPMFMLGAVNNLAQTAVGAGDTLPARVSRVTTEAGYPFRTELNYNTPRVGTQTFQSTTLATDMLSELYLTVDSVDAVMFPSKTGVLEVCERAAAYKPTGFVLGTGGNVNIRLDALTFANDDRLLLHQVSLARAGGTSLTYTQPGFASRYSAGSTQRTNLITQSDNDLAAVAAGLLGRATQPLRPATCTVAADSAAGYGFMRDIDLFNVVNVVDGGFVSYNNYSVCRVTHTLTPLTGTSVWWQCALEFEPTTTSTRT